MRAEGGEDPLTFVLGPGLNYIIGIDGHKTLVSRQYLTKPSSIVSTLFCPCFGTTVDHLPDESRSRCRRCFLSFTFFLSLAQVIFVNENIFSLKYKNTLKCRNGKYETYRKKNRKEI